MFSNIGGKIKGLAKFTCWVGIILSVLFGVGIILGGIASGSDLSYMARSAGFSMDGSAFIVSGIVWAVVGSLLSWVGSWVLYGFGELISKVTEIAENTRRG